MRKIYALLAALAIMAGAVLAGSPAQASPLTEAQKLEAQGFIVKTPAEWASIKTVGYLPAAPSTQARRDPEECPAPPPPGTAEYFCLWNGYAYTGTVWKIPRTWLGDTNGVNDINGLSFYGSGINNASKSWYNRTYYTVRMYDNDSCQNSGWYRNMVSGQEAISWDANTNDWENRVSSVSISQYSGNYCYNTPGQ